MIPLPLDYTRCIGMDCPERGTCARNLTIPIDDIPPGWGVTFVATLRDGESCPQKIEAGNAE